MNRVSYPKIECDDVFATCLLSVGADDQDYVNKMKNIADVIALQWKLFDDRISPKGFHLFKPCLPRRVEQIISKGVTKAELKKLYTSYMLKLDSDARKVYDKLRASAKNGICPMCGIHGVDTLDHYLPKARYPLLSVNPKNLLPACIHCNGAKSADICEFASDQTLYAYADDNKFYETDWIAASISAQYGILTFDFFPFPPKSWLKVERERVTNHFIKFELRNKYVINSSQLITSVTGAIRDMMEDGTDPAAVCLHFSRLAKREKINSTFRVMYNALANDKVICGGNF